MNLGSVGCSCRTKINKREFYVDTFKFTKYPLGKPHPEALRIEKQLLIPLAGTLREIKSCRASVENKKQSKCVCQILITTQ